MHNWSKIFLTLFSVGLLLTGFGCQGLSNNDKQATRPVSLEYWTVYDDVDALQALVNKYRQQRPQITVAIRQLRANEFYSRLVEALADDKGPDIISINTRSFGLYLNRLASMPDTVKDTTIRVEKGQFSDKTIINTNVKSTVSLNQLDQDYVQTVKKDVVRNGKIYGLPLSLDVMAVYYNKDILDRAGIPVPPKTWGEFQAAVKKITKFDKATGKILQSGVAFGTGNNVPASDDLLYILFKQSRLPFTDRNGRVVFNLVRGPLQEGGETPGSVMDFYTDYANSSRDTYSWNESMDNALDKFSNGSVAFFFGYQYHYKQIKTRAPQLNFDILPLPQLFDDTKANSANYTMQSVVAKSKNQNEAWALINYLANSPATKEYLDRSGKLTAERKYIEGQKDKPELAPFVSQLLIADNWYRGLNYEAANKAINDMLTEWLKVPSNPQEEEKWRQQVLDRGASKINQTLP